MQSTTIRTSLICKLCNIVYILQYMRAYTFKYWYIRVLHFRTMYTVSQKTSRFLYFE